RSVDFIENADSSQPFCLFTSFIHPHPPFTPPTPWNKLYRAALMSMPKVPHDSDSLWTFANHVQNRYKYRDQGIDNNLLRTIKAYYYACISFVDFQVGRIIESLEKTGQLDNTIIAFTSDHGELLGDYNCFGKRSMLDSAARVPMIVRHPERIEAGRKCSTPVNLVDIYPTFLAATGSGLPPHRLVGTDMAEIADGADEGRTVYSQFQTGALGVHMACDRNWKYFYSAPDRREFLFDRTTDPDELRDRAGMVLRDRQLAVMRERVIARYMEEGHADAVDGDFFQEFEQPQMPTNPDAGLLIQDPYWSVPLQEIPGYTDPVD
ncbi:MAG: sulfatase-like hydrolase/transferase, partial [Candidatus Latescibacteria bacterium]|nr:sulfatase-like hydrolase/transferase [Candidatus Latescibacterota bacterium]